MSIQVNPSIKFEVFIHKVDGLSDDHKIETQRDIHQRANDDLTDAGQESLHLRLAFVPCCHCPLILVELPLGGRYRQKFG